MVGGFVAKMSTWSMHAPFAASGAGQLHLTRCSDSVCGDTLFSETLPSFVAMAYLEKRRKHGILMIACQQHVLLPCNGDGTA